jgi:hypothetical protein
MMFKLAVEEPEERIAPGTTGYEGQPAAGDANERA